MELGISRNKSGLKGAGATPGADASYKEIYS